VLACWALLNLVKQLRLIVGLVIVQMRIPDEQSICLI
jgi:hypothetical protein